MTGIVAVELAVEKAMTRASRMPRSSVQRPSPGAEADADQVVGQVQGQADEHREDEDAEADEGAEALRADDAGDDAKDGQRNDLDHPVEHDEEDVESHRHEIGRGLKMLRRRRRRAMPRATAMRMTDVILPSSVKGPSRLLGTLSINCCSGSVFSSWPAAGFSVWPSEVFCLAEGRWRRPGR